MVSLKALVLTVIGALIVGGALGFFLGVCSVKAGKRFLRSLVESEQHAQVARSGALDRGGFSLQYPSNWKIDTEDEDYDPDSLFSIESPGSSFVMFFLHDAQIDPNAHLEIHVNAHRKRMTDLTVVPFDRYGRFEGRGAVLRGKLMGIPWTIKAFSVTRNGRSATIVQSCPDEDSAHVQPGFELIENSFVLKPKPEHSASTGPSGD